MTRTAKTVLRVWLLSDGANGHVSQSQGIVDSLAEVYEIELIHVPLKVVSPFWKRIGRLLLPWIFLPKSLLHTVYKIDLPDNNSKSNAPDLIVSSGANTLLASALLAKYYAVANVYSGRLRGYAARCYSVVFTVVPENGLLNNCVLPLPPVPAAIYTVASKPTPSTTFGQTVDQKNTPLLAVLIGGDGAGCHYKTEDWNFFCDFLQEVCLRQGFKLLITTSRRTGAQAEAILKSNIKPDLIEEAVWWLETPKPVIRNFLSRAVAVVVTEDSLTMVAESIYSRHPVWSCAPANAKLDANDEAALTAYSEAGFIQRIKLGVESTRTVLNVESSLKPLNNAAFPDIPAMIRKAIEPHLK